MKNKYEEMKHGDWLFTCNFFPVQFDKWEDSRKNHFTSMNGSSHARFGCGLNPISAPYAKWFIRNNMQSFFVKTGKEGYRCDEDYEKYEKIVRQKSFDDGIIFEGI